VIARTAWEGGAAAFLPTLITAPMDELLRRVARAAAFVEGFDRNSEAAIPLGLHVEGPFLEMPGAHDASQLCDPTPERVDALLEACRGQLRVLTLAPDRPGAVEATRRLTAAGVTVALGHAAGTRNFAACVEAGARCVTHLFNVMSGLHHREPGMVGLALDEARLSCGIILDGVHIHPAVARSACRLLGPERTVVVTDAANAAGMPDGDYELSGMPVTLRDGVVRDREGRLAGSALTMATAAAQYLRIVPGTDARAVARAAARNPAQLAGAADLGAIRPGALARFAVLGADGAIEPLRL
jgi:N-acetylglucosamine-6-phosphate deacetylase